MRALSQLILSGKVFCKGLQRHLAIVLDVFLSSEGSILLISPSLTLEKVQPDFTVEFEALSPHGQAQISKKIQDDERVKGPGG